MVADCNYLTIIADDGINIESIGYGFVDLIANMVLDSGPTLVVEIIDNSIASTNGLSVLSE